MKQKIAFKLIKNLFSAAKINFIRLDVYLNKFRKINMTPVKLNIVKIF